MVSDLRGSVLVFILYDVCEEIRLEELGQILGVQPARREPSFKHVAPEYVRFERPPVVERLEPVTLDTGERFEAQIKYYDYGVASVAFELPFEGGWDDLVHLSCRFISSSEIERRALGIVRQKVKRAAPAIGKPYETWLSEDYSVFHVAEMAQTQSAAELRGP